VPLGGSRVHLPRTVTNLMITMLVSGLWHGAGFCFVIWGGLHGIYLSAYHVARRFVPALDRVAARSIAAPLPFATWLLTYAVGTIGWVYFRASSVGEANGVVAAMFGFGAGTERGPLAEYGLLAAALLVAHFAEAAAWQRYPGWVQAALDGWSRIPGPVQALLATPLAFFLLALTKDVQGAFIYFQF
jgi:alginate O-acetyltransferase complex protein AlgI